MSARLCTTRAGGLPFLTTRPAFLPETSSILPRHQAFRHNSSRHLHQSAALLATAANHYDTLGLAPSASQADIKKQYYQLSKSTHPDRNPDDPHASARFSAVSDAYATLGNTDKRARYDRDVMRSSASGGYAGRSGSYSSSQAGPNGSRPASGLSKRRSPFQGPPPSFYKAGGYGAYGARAGQAEANAESARRQAGAEYTGGGWNDAGTAGGFSPGQGAQRSFGNDVPHFDRQGHYRTQENVMGKTAGRKRRLYRQSVEDANSGGMATGASFIVISSVVTITVLIPFWIMSGGKKEKRKGDG